jgi:hypothetical protein
MFRSQYPDISIKKSSFFELRPPEIKKPKKLTDLCDICVEGKRARCQLSKLLENDDGGESGSEGPRTPEMKEKIEKLKKQVNEFELHYQCKQEQRENFKKQIKDLPERTAILVMDFSANLKINLELEQKGRDYYHQPQRTLFGATLIFRHPETQCLEFFYFDIISECLNHDAFFVSKALIKILEHPVFKEQQFSRLTFWLDNGKHFKNKELFYTFHKIREENKFESVTANYFIVNHGKSFCDGRFGVVKRFVRDFSLRRDGAVKTTQDVITAIKRMSANSKVKSVQLILNFTTVPSEKNIYDISAFSKYHHFVFFVEFCLCSLSGF